MSPRTYKARVKLERVAQMLAKQRGFEPTPGHDEGEFPMLAMAEPKQVGDKVLPANPRCQAIVKEAKELIRAMGKR